MDVAAFTELVRTHQAAVAAVAFAIVRDREQAHDLAQEAFVVAWRKRNELREPERARAWLCGIVRFVARDHRRGERRRQALREEHMGASPAVPPAPATPLDRVIAREDDALVAAVVEELPESYREPLLLHYVAGCSVAEIATALELAEDAVKQRLSRGRAALRDEPRFAAAALALAPTPTFTDAAVRAATAPGSGAGKGTFMTKHPILTASLVLGAIGAGGFAIAKSRGTDSAGKRADGAIRDMSAGSGGSGRVVDGATPKPPRDRAAMLQAIRIAHARASTIMATGGGSGAAPPQTARMVYDFAGEKLVAGVAPAAPSDDVQAAILNKKSIRDGLAGARAEVLGCYEAALKRVPDLAGTLTVTVIVEGEPDIGGMISSATIAKDASTIDDAQLSGCVVDAVSAIELPAPQEGIEVAVNYPFTFSPH